jgi:DNA-binding NtrC family response regulator
MQKLREAQSPAQIALIHNDNEAAELIEAFLRQHDLRIKKFSRIENLMKESSMASFDVILYETNSADHSALDLLQQSRIPIIFIMSQGDFSLTNKAIELGAQDVILKPISFPQLLMSVQRMLQARRQDEFENSESASAISPSYEIVGRSEGLLRAIEMAKRVASCHAHVLITGESGTGKEVIARALHSMGSRRSKAFVTINCSAIPEQLLESELFGHAKGAFTGASGKKLGLFEEAHGGTLFLDEIGEMSLPLQAKLLRVLQDRQIRRIGENQERMIDARVVAATHRDLRQEVKEKRFREDLFFRLNVIPIYLPPLRERKEDILPLAHYFLEKYSRLEGFKPKKFSDKAVEILLSNSWAGNVRELENTVERAVILSAGSDQEAIDLAEFEEVPQVSPPVATVAAALSSERTLSLAEVTREYIKKVLEKNGGAKEKTARELGIDRKTLYRKLSASGDNNREILC